MSSLPGLTLESFVMWQWDLIVDGDGSANFSLSMAELLGNKTRRISINKDQFKLILDLYEEYREDVEYKLWDFDEEENSWRDYAGYNFDFIPNEVSDKAEIIVKNFMMKENN